MIVSLFTGTIDNRLCHFLVYLFFPPFPFLQSWWWWWLIVKSCINLSQPWPWLFSFSPSHHSSYPSPPLLSFFILVSLSLSLCSERKTVCLSFLQPTGMFWIRWERKKEESFHSSIPLLNFLPSSFSFSPFECVEHGCPSCSSHLTVFLPEDRIREVS